VARNEVVMRKGKKKPAFECLECGKKFYSTKAAERATDKGCPGCGGVDIDLYAGGEPSWTYGELCEAGGVDPLGGGW
jgi:Zn finger protein HypA/HybF involved in hydrogenase expression